MREFQISLFLSLCLAPVCIEIHARERFTKPPKRMEVFDSLLVVVLIATFATIVIILWVHYQLDSHFERMFEQNHNALKET